MLRKTFLRFFKLGKWRRETLKLFVINLNEDCLLQRRRYTNTISTCNYFMWLLCTHVPYKHVSHIYIPNASWTQKPVDYKCLLKGRVKRKVRERKKVVGEMSHHILGMRCQKGHSFFYSFPRIFVLWTRL